MAHNHNFEDIAERLVLDGVVIPIIGFLLFIESEPRLNGLTIPLDLLPRLCVLVRELLLVERQYDLDKALVNHWGDVLEHLGQANVLQVFRSIFLNVLIDSLAKKLIKLLQEGRHFEQTDRLLTSEVPLFNLILDLFLKLILSFKRDLVFFLIGVLPLDNTDLFEVVLIVVNFEWSQSVILIEKVALIIASLIFTLLFVMVLRSTWITASHL